MNPTGIFLGALLGVCGLVSPHAGAAPDRPNIVVVLSDDQGIGQTPGYWENLESNGSFPVTERFAVDEQRGLQAAMDAMPTLDRLGREGLVFDNAHVMSAVCAPSRAALMTGRYPQREGIYTNVDMNRGVSLQAIFLPRFLQEAGYRTGAFGKWHLAKTERVEIDPVPSRDYHDNWILYAADGHEPNERGFDEFFGFHLSGASLYGSPSLFKNGSHVPAEGVLPDQITNEAVRFIRETPEDQPFFAYVSYSVPHIPLEERMPERYRERFDTGNPEADNYYASLASMDEGLQRLLEEVEKRGQEENTLLIYLSDNGAVIDSPFPGNLPYTGYKGQYLAGGTQVPFIVWWPAVIEAPGRVGGLTSSMDVLPTALDAAGAPVPDYLSLDGKSLLPWFRGEAVDPPHKELFWAGPRAGHWSEENTDFWRDYWRYLREEIDERPRSELLDWNASGSWAVREGNWSMHWAAETSEMTLYDISRDPGERMDLSADRPDVVVRLTEKIRDWLAPMPPPRVWAREHWEKMRESLGLAEDPGE